MNDLSKLTTKPCDGRWVQLVTKRSKVTLLLIKYCDAATHLSSRDVADQRLRNDCRGLLRLVYSRRLIESSGSTSLTLNLFDPTRIASELMNPPSEIHLSSALILPVIEEYVGLMEEPADSGVSFFVRMSASTWGFEMALSVFYSAILVTKWLSHLISRQIRSQGQCPRRIPCTV